MSKLPPLAALCATLGLAAGAAAQTAPVDRQARTWAAACAACHGTDGRAQGSLPVLAGRNADELLQILLAFRSGQRQPATVMHQHAKGYTDDELRRLAQHFAAQTR
ncbi:MAG: c-type cytochrome [Rubrivivax sp.]